MSSNQEPIRPASGVLTSDEMSSITNQDRLLPSQPFLRKYFQGDDAAYHARLEAMLLRVLPETDVARRWDIETKPGVTYASLGSDLVSLALWQFLVRAGGCRRVLELGTFYGVSALHLAEAAGPEGLVTTVERGEEFFEIARRNFERNGMAHRIEPVLGGAIEMLLRYVAEGRCFDFVVIDAGKEDYADMLEPALACLAPGGILLVDDIFLQGDALNSSPVTEKGKGVQRFLDRAEPLVRAMRGVILPLGNGILLVQKPRG